MHSPKFTTSLLLAFLAPALAQQSGAGEEGNCTVFDWDQNAAYISEYRPVRISGAKLCDNDRNQTCPLTADGDKQFGSSNNLTNFVNRYYVPLVQETVDDPDMPAPAFNESVIAAMDQTLKLEPGQAAYMNFTAFEFCYAGTMSNCTGSLTDGVGVEFCAPLWRNDGDTLIAGEYTLVNISREDVDQYDDPYENQVSGEGDGSAAGRTAVLSAASVGLAFVAAAVAGML